MLPIAIASLESHIAYCKARMATSIPIEIQEAENILNLLKEYRELIFNGDGLKHYDDGSVDT